MTAKDSKPRKLRSIGVVRNWLATAETSVANSQRIFISLGPASMEDLEELFQ